MVFFKMTPSLVVVLFIGLLTNSECGTFDNEWKPIVLTTSGQVQGNVINTRLDRSFYAFRGIRYGKAPVGDLRFKAPVPAESWSEVFDAKNDGPMCIQYRANNDYSDTSEDCLRLNVYTHNVSYQKFSCTMIDRPFLHFRYMEMVKMLQLSESQFWSLFTRVLFMVVQHKADLLVRNILWIGT